MKAYTRHLKTDEEKFFVYVSPEPNSGCWLWTGTLDRNGYGRTTIRAAGRGRYKFAHRIAYELFVEPIPSGLVIDHKCKVHCCVNPSHLEAVTLEENVRRGNGGQAARKRHMARTHCKRGHPFSGENLAVNPDGSRRCKTCHRTMLAHGRKRRKYGDRSVFNSAISFGILSFGV